MPTGFGYLFNGPWLVCRIPVNFYNLMKYYVQDVE